MQTYFNNQLYALEHGLSPADQHAYDVRMGEFAGALTEFWSERARSRRGFNRWLGLYRRVRARFTPGEQIARQAILTKRTPEEANDAVHVASRS